MTREEIKDMLPTLRAYAKGKTIEWQDENGEWQPISDISLLITSGKNSESYRIKPESKYRSFRDADECWNEMLKHKPFGWVMRNTKMDESFYENITTVMSMTVWINAASDEDKVIDYYGMLKKYVFVDGTPFGINEGGIG